MKRLKQWFILQIQLLLGIDELKLSIDTLNIENNSLKKRIEILEKTINISADINIHERDTNWMVISIHGKADYVSFMRLPESDLRDISSFMRQFERNNITMDLPYMMSKDQFNRY